MKCLFSFFDSTVSRAGPHSFHPDLPAFLPSLKKGRSRTAPLVDASREKCRSLPYFSSTGMFFPLPI